MAGPNASSHRILYDRDCGFCRWTLAWMLRWDRARRLEPLALQEPVAAEVLGDMAEEERFASWHLADPSGAVASAGAAVAPMLRLLPFGRPLAALADAVPALVARLYMAIANRRAHLSRLLSAGAVSRADRLIAGREASARGKAPIPPPVTT